MSQLSTNNGGFLAHTFVFFIRIAVLLSIVISFLCLFLSPPLTWYLLSLVILVNLSLVGIYLLKHRTPSSLLPTMSAPDISLEYLLEPTCIYNIEKEQIVANNTAINTLFELDSNGIDSATLNNYLKEIWERSEYALSNNQFQQITAHTLTLTTLQGLEKNLQVSIKNISTKSNQYLIQLRDITAQRKRLKAQEKSTEYIKFIVNSLPVTIFTLNLKGKFVLAQGEGIEPWQLNGQPLQGQSFFRLYRDNADAVQTLEKALTGEQFETDLAIGKAIFNVRFSPLHSINKTRIGVIVVAIDVTKAKQAAQQLKQYNFQLEQRNKELQTFTKIAAHDLKEPLRLVSNYLQLLEMRYKHLLDENGIEYIDFAVGGAKRLHALITDLMLYNSLELNKKLFKEVDCAKIIAFVKHNLKIPLQENNAQIATNNLSTVFGNENHLLQLFQNLISNALKYRSEASPIININVIEKNNHYLFEVADNGIGIDKEYKERIFDIFQRLENINVKAQNGTGIGLSICKKIVQLHDGKIWVESEGSGKGSRFYFTIAKRQH